MKKQTISIMTIFAAVILLSGCQAIGDIFKAGVWVGVLVVVGVIGLIIFIISKAGNKN
jgi:uncharacterized lipoprotein YajG